MDAGAPADCSFDVGGIGPQMVDEPKAFDRTRPLHRGRIQAQGAGTEESVSWAQDRPPTESDMLAMCEQLEGKLTRKELRDRERAFAELREHIRDAARSAGVSSVPNVRKSFPRTRRLRNARVDFEVLSGVACVPDPE